MHKVIESFLTRLTYGESENVRRETGGSGFVETLARVYEKARNAMEYRADHLVRRAAIERIIKRRALIDRDPVSITRHLITELRWARYLALAEINEGLSASLESIITKYVSYLDGVVPTDWVIKIASAEIEEKFNLNTDYNDFTMLAFQVIKKKVNLSDENSDLLIYFAVDKTYAGSDDEQILYHMLKLGGSETNKEKLTEAYRLFNLAKNHKDLSRIIKFVRRQMPPLILLRDMYFYSPKEFKTAIGERGMFTNAASDVLDIQLTQMSGRVATAGVRSVVYVFLTKMVLVVAIEIPIEILLYGHLAKIPLIINLLFPPALMWATTLKNRLPNSSERDALVTRLWHILENFDDLENEDDALTDKRERKVSTVYSIFSAFYIVLFIAIFGVIYFTLGKIGFTFATKLVFIFFLTIIAFFAYRISQIAKVYSWKVSEDRSNLGDLVALPILTIGSRLSKGLARLNFMTFAFDFILEAPFKIILGILDSWVQFISVKKEEEIIE